MDMHTSAAIGGIQIMPDRLLQILTKETGDISGKQPAVGIPHLRTLIQMVADAQQPVCLIAPGGSVLGVSLSAAEMFGYSSLGFRKQHIADFFTTAQPLRLPAKGRSVAPGFTITDCTGVTKKGIEFRVQVTAGTVWDAEGNFFYYLFFQDLTVQVCLQQQMDLLVRNTDEPFLLIDRKLNILLFNDQMQILYKAIRNKELQQGDCILDHALPERKTFLRSIYKRVFEGEEIKDEVERVLHDTELHRYTVLYRPAEDADRNVAGILIIIREILPD
jgi:PAS domain-containing protein